MIIYFFAALPDLFSPWSDRITLATAIVNDAKALELYKPTLLSRIFSFPFMYISRNMLILIYTCWSIILYIRFLTQRQEKKIFVRQRFMIIWLSVLLLSLLTLILSHTLLTINFTITGSKLIFALKAMNFLSYISLTVLLLSPFFVPEVLYGLPRVPWPTETSEAAASDVLKSQLPKHYAEIRFENDYLMLISDKAISCMQELHPFLQPDFNLAQLSVLIHVPLHHLAYWFREVKKQSFIDFRNEWRVEHAKQLIREGKSDELTLEAIGLLSGFSARNTFLNAFKKVEGICPQTFLSKVRDK
jgi:AraC-like DNA-binding protein/predicted RNase H-like HicB family nuclease